VTADVPPSDVLPSREGERFGDGAGPKAGVAVAEGKQWFGHPRGLSTLFMTEMWERFSYYGGRALLILYMTDAVATGGLGLTVAEAGALYGLYTAVVYMTNLPGGWLADKFLGARNAVFYGDKAIDRSPCGTGTSARMAQLAARGALKPGDEFVHESIIGSLFNGRVEAVTRVGDREAIVPSIEGWARITGFNTIFIDDRDPYAHGFQVV